VCSPDIFIKVSASAIITCSYAKRRGFSLFLVLCIPFMLSVFHFESISVMYVFSGVGEGDQLCPILLLIYTDCVILLYMFLRFG